MNSLCQRLKYYQTNCGCKCEAIQVNKIHYLVENKNYFLTK